MPAFPRRLRSPSRRGAVSAAALALAGVAGAAAPDGAAVGQTGAATVSWSAPAALAGCDGSAPRVVFPSSSPYKASGPGAIVYGGTAAPCPPRGVAGATLVSRLTGDDLALAPRAIGSMSGPAAVAGTTRGTIVVGGGIDATHGVAPGAAVSEGPAGGPFQAPRRLSLGSGLIAATSAYLGDVAVASLQPGHGRAPAGIAVWMQRFFAHSLGRPVALAPTGPGVTGLTIGLDYRTDAILTWVRAGRLLAREIRQGGALGPAQTLGRAGSQPDVQALISDDSRSIVAWSDQRPRSDNTVAVRVYVDVSAPGVRFGAPQLIDSFREPAGFYLPPGSLRLIRLSSETVLLAWTGMSAGRFVVRAAPVGTNGVHSSVQVSDGTADAQLAGLAPGPRNEALAVWTQAPRAQDGFDYRAVQILAARGNLTGSFHARFGAPELVAPPAANGRPDVAVDPATDRAVAVWRSGLSGPVAEYAVRAEAAAPAAARRRPQANLARPLSAGWLALIGVAAVGGNTALLVRAARAAPSQTKPSPSETKP